MVQINFKIKEKITIKNDSVSPFDYYYIYLRINMRSMSVYASFPILLFANSDDM